jgi:Plavaka transposase
MVGYTGQPLFRLPLYSLIFSSQSGLPFVEGIPHCFLPLILWMDKGRVTKRVKKHPILLRAAFLPGEIRNASGNGGGVLVGYMPVVSTLR